MTQRYKSPKGLEIIGTLETLSGCAIVSGITADGEPLYAGETDIWWDEQKTVSSNGRPLFVDDHGNTWTFDQLTPLEDQ